jgi:catechol 2,3-dioxygenase-like lactoylglutathione lyase family enzyme
MRLAKNHLDIGLSTQDWSAAEAFWGTRVGLEYEEFLKIGSGVRQHRFGCNGSVIKINHSRDPLEHHPTVHRVLRIATDLVTAPTPTHDPEGVSIELVPRGFDGVVGVEILNAVSDAGAARRFWVDGLGGEEVEANRYRIGDTLVRCVVEPDLVPMTTRSGAGWRYLTVQVWDVDAEHQRMLDLGFAEEFRPMNLGSTARISFVRDADGMFLEISQRASLTGPLPSGH